MTAWILTSSILILGIVSLRQLLKGRIAPGFQYALWLLVLVRLLIPGSLTASPMSVENLLPREAAVQAAVAEPMPDRVSADVQTEAAAPETTVTPVPTTGSPVPESKAAPFDWSRLLKSIWIAGMLLAGLALLGSNLSFYLRLRRSRNRLDLDLPLPVYQAEGLPSPCLFGLFRPTVYVAAAYAEDRQAMAHILAHEWSHYKQGDHLWSLLRGAALCVHWYNPLVWLAAVLSKQDAELACDAAAIRRLGEEQRLPYGRTLLKLVTGKPRPADLLTCATTMTSGKRSLKQRITYIAQKPKNLAVTAVLAVLAAAVAVGCTFTGAETPEILEAGTAALSDAEDPADGLSWEASNGQTDPVSLGDAFLSGLSYDADRELLILPEGPYDGWTIRVRGAIPMDSSNMSYHDDFSYEEAAGETGHSREISLSGFQSAELELLCFDETGQVLYDGSLDLLTLLPEEQAAADLPAAWMEALGSAPSIQYLGGSDDAARSSELRADLSTEAQLAALEEIFSGYTWTPYVGPSTVSQSDLHMRCASADGTQTLLFQEYQGQVRVYADWNGKTEVYDGSGSGPITAALLDLCNQVLLEAQGDLLSIAQSFPTEDWGEPARLGYLTGLDPEAGQVTFDEVYWVEDPDAGSGFRLDPGPEGQTLPLAGNCQYWILYRHSYPCLRLSAEGMQQQLPEGGLFRLYVQNGQVIAVCQRYIP